MRSPEWSERTSRRTSRRNAEDTRQKGASRGRGLRNERIRGTTVRGKHRVRMKEESLGKTAGNSAADRFVKPLRRKKTRRASSISLLFTTSSVSSIVASVTARAEPLVCRVCVLGETQRNRTRIPDLFFWSRIDWFSLFLKTRSFLFAIYRLPAFPCPACLSVFALGRSGAACVHEHFNLFFFIRPHYLRRYTRLHDIVNWVFSRNATGIPRYLRLTET